MPTYVYECSSCKKRQEIMQKITAEPLTKCPECGSDTLRRVVPNSVAIQFKGSGFYKTDYADKPKQNPSCSKPGCNCE